MYIHLKTHVIISADKQIFKNDSFQFECPILQIGPRMRRPLYKRASASARAPRQNIFVARFTHNIVLDSHFSELNCLRCVRNVRGHRRASRTRASERERERVCSCMFIRFVRGPVCIMLIAGVHHRRSSSKCVCKEFDLINTRTHTHTHFYVDRSIEFECTFFVCTLLFVVDGLLYIWPFQRGAAARSCHAALLLLLILCPLFVVLTFFFSARVANARLYVELVCGGTRLSR